MKEVIIDDKFLSGLEKLNPPMHTESEIYRDGGFIYKIFRSDTPLNQIKRKEKKLVMLDEVSEELTDVVIPIDRCYKIVNGRKVFKGCKMDYINGDMLFYRRKELNFNIFLSLMVSISESLNNIHNNPSKIVLGDLNFYNILIDDILKFYFIDFDGVSIGDYTCERISYFASIYYKYRKTKLKINRNLDRLSMLLYFWDTIFPLSIWEITDYEFDEKAEKLKFLNEIRDLVKELKKVGRIVPYVPYLHEIIGESDINIKNIDSRRVLK